MKINYLHNGHLLVLALILLSCIGSYRPLYGQGEEVLREDALQDSAKFRRYDILPAISYSPETKLTLGIIGYRYLDLSKGIPSTTRSFINLIAVYTTANQIIIESNWDLFTAGNGWRFNGTAAFNKYPDRNYGLGNDADALVYEYEISENLITDTTILNYRRFNINRFYFSPIFLKELSESIYAGFSFDLEYQWNFEDLADSFEIVNKADEIRLLDRSLLGLRSGLGLAFTYDSRDILLNARKGWFFNFRNKYFGRYLGSDFRYITLEFDGRKYFNPFSNHTLALRGVTNFRFTNDPVISMRGLSRVGGISFVRGYFTGTFQDNHMLAFETEYRLPLWKDNNIAPFYKFWKRLGLTAFFSGAQVFSNERPLNASSVNLAAGGGIRILFNPESKVNLRIDYAVGLRSNSNGPGRRQTGLYFFLAEAF